MISSRVYSNLRLSSCFINGLGRGNSTGFDNSRNSAVSKDEIELIEKPSDVNLLYPHPILNNQTDEEKLDSFLKRSACAFGRTALVVTPSGKVLPCEQLPTKAPFILGDLSKETLIDIWNSEKLLSTLYPQKEHFKGTECFDCDDYSSCILTRGWCIRDIYKVYNSDVGVQPECPKSTHTMRLT